MKKCIRCELIKDENKFYRNHDDCKPCWNAYCSERRKIKKEKDPDFLEKRRLYLQEWRAKNKDREKEYTKKYLEKNKDKIAERRKTPEARSKMNILVKAWRERNKDRFKKTEKVRRKKDRKKELARALIKKHVTRGHVIKPVKCQICGSDKRKIEAHHKDYDIPLEVRWLCNVCHRHQHNKLMDVKP